jgi:hypothetical protein
MESLKGYLLLETGLIVAGKFNLGINLETAVKYGIVIPPDILNLAGDNVYH